MGWQYTPLTYSLPNLDPVCCSMSSSNWCFLTCIQISQEAGKVVWYSHLLQNFPQFVVIHTVKGFGIVNNAEIDVFLELSCFLEDPMDHQKNKRIPEKRLLLLSLLQQSLWLSGSWQAMENSSRDGNTRPPDLPLEKSVCRSRNGS